MGKFLLQVDDDRSISKTIKDALEIVERTKALERFEKIKARETNRPYKQRKSFRHLEKAKEDVKQHAVDNRFRVSFFFTYFIYFLHLYIRFFSATLLLPAPNICIFNLLILILSTALGQYNAKNAY